MRVVESRQDIWRLVKEWRAAGDPVALVPTMGNLHEAHLSLLDVARKYASRVIASIFVNPTQFGEGEDYQTYPRTLDDDVTRLEAAGCDLAFVPEISQIYPCGIERATLLAAAPDLASRLEGRFRPGHFDGVVTVVARLFAIVAPDIAVFGEKDYQQLLVIRRMTEDLGFNIDVVAGATVRTDSGLALSSRNAYLKGDQQEASLLLNRVLSRTARAAESHSDNYEALEASAVRDLEAGGFRVDYVAIRRSEDLAEPGKVDHNLRVLAAAWCGTTRLIDNMAIVSHA